MSSRLIAAALVLLCLGLAACRSEPDAPAPFTPTASSTATPSAFPSPSSTPATPTATAIPPTPIPACLSEPGTVMETELVDPDLPRSLPYRIYIPACAEQSPGRLPTLYLFHGLSYSDSQWDDLGVDELADLLISLRVTQPFLIVMPWERLGLDYEPTIVQYLLPHIESEYAGASDPELRAVGGISRGAGWALRIGLGHAELFGAVGLHSPAVLAPDLFNLPGWVEGGPVPELWIDIGNRDPLRFALADLTALLDQLAIEYRFRSFAGEHSLGYWDLHLEEYLRWYVSHWN